MKKTLCRFIGAIFVMAVINLGFVGTVHAATIKITRSFGPQSTDPSFVSYATQAATTIQSTGTLPTGVRQGPSDARSATNIVVEDIMASPVNINLYRGDFNPTGVWTNSHGTTLWFWIDVEAGEGEMVSLSGLSGVLSSTETNNLLGKTFVFSPTGNSYSATAIGITAGGGVINSGQAANTLVKRVIVGIGSKYFPVSNPTDVLNVRNFLNPIVGWGVKCVVNVSVASGTSSITTTSTSTIQKSSPPKLTASLVGGQFVVMSENNGDVAFYPVETATEITGSWTTVGNLQGGQAITIARLSPMLFVRYRLSP